MSSEPKASTRTWDVGSQTHDGQSSALLNIGQVRVGSQTHDGQSSALLNFNIGQILRSVPEQTTKAEVEQIILLVLCKYENGYKCDCCNVITYE